MNFLYKDGLLVNHGAAGDIVELDKTAPVVKGSIVLKTSDAQDVYKRQENEQRYSFWIIMFFGALSAGGFAVFFGGNYLEAGCSFLIGLLIKAVSALMEDVYKRQRMSRSCRNI